MGSQFVHEMLKKREEIEKNDLLVLNYRDNIQKVKKMVESLDVMFSLEELSYNVNFDNKTGSFIIEEKLEYDNKSYSAFSEFDTPKKIIEFHLAKSTKKNAKLILGFEPSGDLVNVIKEKYAIHYHNYRGMSIINFSAFHHSLENNDFADLLSQLVDDYSDRKRTSKQSASNINFGTVNLGSLHNFGTVDFDSLRSVADFHNNPCQGIVHQPKLQTALMLSRGAGKSSYAYKQTMKQLEKETTKIETRKPYMYNVDVARKSMPDTNFSYFEKQEDKLKRSLGQTNYIVNDLENVEY